MISNTRATAERIAAKYTDCSARFAERADAIESALNEERERCAKICDYYKEEDGDIASQAAAAIRSEVS